MILGQRQIDRNYRLDLVVQKAQNVAEMDPVTFYFLWDFDLPSDGKLP